MRLANLSCSIQGCQVSFLGKYVKGPQLRIRLPLHLTTLLRASDQVFSLIFFFHAILTLYFSAYSCYIIHFTMTLEKPFCPFSVSTSPNYHMYLKVFVLFPSTHFSKGSICNQYIHNIIFMTLLFRLAFWEAPHINQSSQAITENSDTLFASEVQGNFSKKEIQTNYSSIWFFVYCCQPLPNPFLI